MFRLGNVLWCVLGGGDMSAYVMSKCRFRQLLVTVMHEV